MEPFLTGNRTRQLLAWVVVALPTAAIAQVDEDSDEECTVGVACGKATPDGRPLLWKTRDTSSRHNEVVRFTDGKYEYLALVTAGQDRSAWAGSNEKGFCIMNSVSTDFRRGGAGNGPGNGPMMKMALQSCATVAEFEALLKKTDESGRRTRANFGVIDATGAAAVFETSPDSFTRFDANDPKIAPKGFIVRSNFAMTAKNNAKVKSRSIERYRRGNQLCDAAVDEHDLTPKQLLRQFCRDLADTKGVPITIPVEGKRGSAPKGTLDNDRCIARPSTKSAVVFHGIKRDEDPELTTFWVILGEPLFSIAVPCWVRAGGVAPELDGDKRSPLCSTAIAVRDEHYVVRKTNDTRARNRQRSFLKTAELKQIWQKTYPAEDVIFAATVEQLEAWRRATPEPGAVRSFHERMAKQAHAALRKLEPVRTGEK